MKIIAFGQERELVDHLRSLISTNTVTLPSGESHLTELAVVLTAALATIETNESFLRIYEQSQKNKSFTVRSTIHKSEYMVDGHQVIQDVRQVQAQDKQEAYNKIEQYWESKTDEYSVYYTVVGMEAEENL